MALNPARAMLTQGKTALLICDIQSKLSKVIYEFDRVVTNTNKLIEVYKLLDVPMIVTEQVPSSLGPTVSKFDLSGVKGIFPKTQFSMCIPEVKETLYKACNGNRPESVVLLGLEAHGCIEYTAIDLKQDGFEVHIVADCTSARTQEERLLAFERMKQIGCYIATTENVIFKMMKDSKHEQFKKIAKFLNSPDAQV